MAEMIAADLLEQFESLTLAPGAFGHREHLFVAWSYLRGAPFEEAAARFVINLKRFAAHAGAAHKFHATITWALLLLVAEAIDRSPQLEFEAWLAERPDLLEVRALLAKHYPPEIFDSEAARRLPLLPRRGDG